MYNLEPNRTRYFLGLAALIAAALVWTACQGPKPVARPAPEPFKLGKVALLPFVDMTRIYGQNSDVRCPVCGRVFETGPVADDAAGFLSARAFELASRRDDLEVIAPGMGRGVVADIFTGARERSPSRMLIAEAGRSLGADTVMTGFIYRYRERIGKSYSVDTPASVAFGVHLVRTLDGRIVWTQHFDETQRTLSENLFGLGQFMQRGGAWITAPQMAAAALEKMIADIPAQ